MEPCMTEAERRESVDVIWWLVESMLSTRTLTSFSQALRVAVSVSGYRQPPSLDQASVAQDIRER